MEQYFYNKVNQVAGRNIINIYVNFRNEDIDINTLSKQNLLKAIKKIKTENSRITQQKSLNFSCITILIIGLTIIFVTLFYFYSTISTDTQNNQSILLSNWLLLIAILIIFQFLMLIRELHTHTKYLLLVLIENNQIIYQLENEIKKSKLRKK